MGSDTRFRWQVHAWLGPDDNDLLELDYEHDDLPAPGEPTTWRYYKNHQSGWRSVDIQLSFEDLNALIAKERALRSYLKQKCHGQLPVIDICGWIASGVPPDDEKADL